MDPRMSDAGFPMKIGDEEYKASMFTDKDLGDLDLYIKAAFIANAVNAANLLEDKEEAVAIKKIALSQATLIGWYTIERVGIMASPEGVIHLGFQLIRKRHPEVTFLQFHQEVAKNYAEAFQQISIADQLLNYPNKEDKEGEPGGAPTGSEKSI